MMRINFVTMQEARSFSPLSRNPATYVEVVRARAPRGFSAAIREASTSAQMTTSEFIRLALAEKLRQSGDVDNHEGD
jgi:hypothetical protein